MNSEGAGMKLTVQDLIDRKLVVCKEYENGLKILKYHKKVFWDNLWHVDDRLLKCRGTVVDKNWNIVVHPFDKCFNVGENNTMLVDEPVYSITHKVNGFMFALTNHPEHGVITSTTGSLDSDFVSMGMEYVKPHLNMESVLPLNTTSIFECCHPNDPHIVTEQEGLHLLAIRNITDGTYVRDQGIYNTLCEKLGAHPVTRLSSFTGTEITSMVKRSNNEGLMILDLEGNYVAKMKSPHYLIKKFFMRMGKKKLANIFNNPYTVRKQIDEEYYPLLDFIVGLGKEEWEGLDEQSRRKLIEEFLGNG